MLDTDNFQKTWDMFQERYEKDLDDLARSFGKVKKHRDQLQAMLKGGMLDPILDNITTIGSEMWVYAALPLDKALFNRKVNELKDLGWDAGSVEMSSYSASCMFTMNTDLGRVRLYVTAYGQGVRCRIVELEDPVPYKPGLYEWVCEEGAEEMEETLANE